MEGFKRLSEDVIKKYDYFKTRKNVEKFMAPLCELIYIYKNITPPSITSHLGVDSEIRNSMPSRTSSTENYVMKRLDTMKDIQEYYNEIQYIFDMLNESEKICFSGFYVEALEYRDLEYKLNVSHRTINRILESSVIKVALLLNIAVLNEEK